MSLKQLMPEEELENERKRAFQESLKFAMETARGDVIPKVIKLEKSPTTQHCQCVPESDTQSLQTHLDFQKQGDLYGIGSNNRIIKNKKEMMHIQVTYSEEENEKEQLDKTDVLAKERSKDLKTSAEKAQNKDAAKTPSESNLAQKGSIDRADEIKGNSWAEGISGASNSHESVSGVESNKIEEKYLNSNDLELELSIETLADQLATALATVQTAPKLSMEYNSMENILKSKRSDFAEYDTQNAHANITSDKNYTFKENRTEDRKHKHKANRQHVINYGVPKHKTHIKKPANEETSKESGKKNAEELGDLKKRTLGFDPPAVQHFQMTLCETETRTIRREMMADDNTSSLQGSWTSAETRVYDSLEQLKANIYVENAPTEQIQNAQTPGDLKGNSQDAKINFKSMEAFTSKGHQAEGRGIKTWTQRTPRTIGAVPACKTIQERIVKNNTNRQNEKNIRERDLYYLQMNTINTDSSSIKQLDTKLPEFRTSNTLYSTDDRSRYCIAIAPVCFRNVSHKPVEQNIPVCRQKKNNAYKSKCTKEESVDVGCQTIEQEVIVLQSTSQAPATQNKVKTKTADGYKNKPRKTCTAKSKTKKKCVKGPGITTNTRYTDQLSIDDTQVITFSTEARQTDNFSIDNTHVNSISIDARPTDQLFVADSQEDSISTKGRQTGQLHTGGAQSNTSAELRQTDNLSVEPQQISTSIDKAESKDGEEEHGQSSCAMEIPRDKEIHSGEMNAERHQAEVKNPLDSHSRVADLLNKNTDGIEMDCSGESKATYNHFHQDQKKIAPCYEETFDTRKRRVLDPRKPIKSRISKQMNKCRCGDSVATEFTYLDQWKAIHDLRAGVLNRLNKEATSRTAGSSQRKERENKVKTGNESKSSSEGADCYSRYCQLPTSRYPGASEGDEYELFQSTLQYPTSLLHPDQPKHETCIYEPFYCPDYESKMQPETIHLRPEYAVVYSKKWTMQNQVLAEFLWCAGIVIFILFLIFRDMDYVMKYSVCGFGPF